MTKCLTCCWVEYTTYYIWDRQTIEFCFLSVEMLWVFFILLRFCWFCCCCFTWVFAKRLWDTSTLYSIVSIENCNITWKWSESYIFIKRKQNEKRKKNEKQNDAIIIMSWKLYAQFGSFYLVPHAIVMANGAHTQRNLLLVDAWHNVNEAKKKENII